MSVFKLQRQDSGITRRLATEMTLEPHTGPTKYVTKYGQVSAFALVDGVDMNQEQQLSDSSSSYTPVEVGAQVLLGDTTIRRSGDPDLMFRTGRILANAIDLKEDQDGVAQAANFLAGGAGGIPGTGNVLSVGSFGSANSRLRTGNSTSTAQPAPLPYHAVCHPYSLQAIVGRMIPLTTTNTTTFYTTTTQSSQVAAGARSPGSDDLIRQGLKAVDKIWDINIFSDANVAFSSTDAKNFAFAQEGLVYVSELAPYFETHRDPSWRATELNMITAYIFGTYLPSQYGVYMLADGTAPTA